MRTNGVPDVHVFLCLNLCRAVNSGANRFGVPSSSESHLFPTIRPSPAPKVGPSVHSRTHLHGHWHSRTGHKAGLTGGMVKKKRLDALKLVFCPPVLPTRSWFIILLRY